jgi:methylated-DNA-[protein]-cysteine S-methyltransferase
MTTKQTFVMDTPFGRLRIQTRGDSLCGIDFVNQRTALRKPANAFQREVARQIRQYCRQPAFRFDLPVVLDGTPHQRKVWRAMSRIGAGRTASYGSLARQLGSSPRAVGNACRANPLPIVQPCHRVVAADGPGGFAGRRTGTKLDLKRRLLAHEGIEI